MTRRGGFSLLEIILALTLAALAVALMVLLGPSLIRTWRRCDQQSDVQRTALLCLLQMRNEMSQGYGPSLQCATANQVSFASRLDIYGNQQYAPTGQPLWQKWVTFRWDAAQQQLIRRYDGWPQPQPQVANLNYVALTNGIERKVGSNVSLFLVRVLPSGLLLVDLTARQEGEQAHLQTILTALGEESD